MNINEIKKRIEEEYNTNCSKINELEKKIWLLERSSFETKLILTCAFSLLPWFVTVLIGPSILKSGFIPLELTKPLFAIVPALLGTIASTIINKKQKIDERIKKFSKASKEREKIEEEAKYKIQQKNLRSYNTMLEKYYGDLESNERLISSLSDKYNNTAKENDTRNKEEIEKNVENLEQLLEEKINDLNIATTRHTLTNLFWKVRSKFDRVIDVSVFGGLGMVFCMMLYNLPMLQANSIKGIQFSTSILGTFAPAIIGGIICSGYGLKRGHDRLWAFKNINNELGENAFAENENFSIRDLEQEKNEMINNVYAVRKQLDTDTQKLESLKNEAEQIHKNDLDKNFEPSLDGVLAEEKNVVLKRTLSK